MQGHTAARAAEETTMPKLFTPSSHDLLRMIRLAEVKCDADVEQARLRDEAEGDRRYARQWWAEVQGRRYRGTR
jgi:hypothetical protein